MQVEHSIKVNYESTNDPVVAEAWLQSLPDTFAADFETAIRYTSEEVEDAKLKMVDPELPRRKQVYFQSIANASALGHPYHCTITHCSIAYSEKDAYVFIIDNQEIADIVLNFLVETEKLQVWHNYSYDGRFLMYYANANAKNVEDTQIFAKTLVNHVEVFKANTGLKDLAGHWYGDWAISADAFDVSQQYEEYVLKYAAIDACATFKLWEYLNEFINE